MLSCRARNSVSEVINTQSPSLRMSLRHVEIKSDSGREGKGAVTRRSGGVDMIYGSTVGRQLEDRAEPVSGVAAVGWSIVQLSKSWSSKKCGDVATWFNLP